VDSEIVTNEPTDVRDTVTNEPTAEGENVTNEPTDVRDNALNEATDARENMTNEAAVAADVGLESLTYMKAAEQNLTFEPVCATPSGGSQVGDIYLAQVIRPSWRTPAGSGLTSSAGPAFD
jgi:hypothetical protein